MQAARAAAAGALARSAVVVPAGSPCAALARLRCGGGGGGGGGGNGCSRTWAPTRGAGWRAGAGARGVRTSAARLHDHSKNIIGRDDGSAPRQDDWWEVRPPVPEDAPEVTFHVELPGGSSTVSLVGKAGESVEDVAKREGLVEGACDGNCQCSTCHVFVPKKEDRDRLGMPDSIEDFEIDMLELAREYDKDPDASRLSCQIVLTEELDGLTVRLPGGTTNYMDHLPFE